LLQDEAIIRLVFVESPDDIITVAPDLRPTGIPLVAVGFGIAD
jgi:hypothetical protein